MCKRSGARIDYRVPEIPIGAVSWMQQIDDFSVRTPCFIPGQIPRQKLEKHVCRQQQQQVFGVRPFWGPPAARGPVSDGPVRRQRLGSARSTEHCGANRPGSWMDTPWRTPRAAGAVDIPHTAHASEPHSSWTCSPCCAVERVDGLATDATTRGSYPER